MSEGNFSPYAAPKAEIGAVLPAKSLPIWLVTLRVVAVLLNTIATLVVGLVLFDQLGVDYRNTPASYLTISFGVALLLIGNLMGMIAWRGMRILGWLLITANVLGCGLVLYEIVWNYRDLTGLIAAPVLLLPALVILVHQLRARHDADGAVE